MKKKLLLFFFIVSSLFSSSVHAAIVKDSLITSTSTKRTLLNVNKLLKQKLFELDKKYPTTDKEFQYTSNASEFSFKQINSEYPILQEVENNRQEAEGVINEVEETGKWVDTFSNEDIQTLPVGIQHEVSGVTYQIGFAKARFTKDYTELTVFARIKLPQTDERGEPIQLFFGANNVKLSHSGGLIGQANLVLLGDVFIPFNKGNWLFSLKGGFDMETGLTQNNTYITIDCDGVKELGLQGEVQFSRKMLLPVDNEGNLAPETRMYTNSAQKKVQIPNRVRGNFNMVGSDWNDLVIELSLSPFVLTKHPDKFMFTANQATFDFSDLRTPEVNFPNFYEEKGLLQPNREAWRGVYVQSLQIALPKEFKTEESISQNKRVTFNALNMIIDNHGVSGYFSVENLIPLKSGRTSNTKAWAYSVDKFGLELAANNLIGADFSGAIVLPVSKNAKATNAKGEKIETLGLGYSGIISEEEYGLSVSTLEELNFDVFQAKAQLAPNSSVELLVENGNFRPRAILNGYLDISAKNNPETDEKALTNFKGVQFQNLVLQTTSPILQADYFGYKKAGKFSNFPVSIPEVALVANEYETSLIFGLSINLMSKGFSGSTRLKIQGEISDEDRKQRWRFKGLDLAAIAIDADLGGVQLNGALELMRNDPEYGNGFAAEIQGTFGGFGPITTKAIFGKKDFRYWYVDASVRGLKINIGPVQLSGFAGGASYRMTRRQGVSASEFSPSGLSYIPSDRSGLGVKAMIIGSIGDETAVSIGAGFEIEFNKKGGMNRLGFFGEAKVMKALEFANPASAMQDQLQGMVNNEALQGVMDSKAGKTFLDKSTEEYPKSAAATATIEGKIGVNFDFVNDSFHADMELYVNTPGGFLQGYGPGGLAGWGVIHVSKKEWYAHLGTPSKRVGLRLGVGPISVETTGYFMVGDRLEGSPPPPPEVAEILGVELSELDYMRDENALSSGKGFAFGTNFKVDTGDLRFLIFYARFMAGAGFDIMLRDYGEASCKNTGKQIGIDGWYANGQAYVYLQGELGIRIKLFFVKKKIPIISAGAAVLLQAKAPNPIWIKGYLGGYYNLLGGLVKGRFRFKLEIGEVCELENASPLGGIKMITGLTPKENTDDVDVFAAPQAAFSMKVNEPIIIPDDQSDKTYKVLLDKFEVTDESGKLIEGEMEWATSKDRVTFYSTDILPPNTKLKVVAEVSFLEKVNGVFQTVNVDGQKAVEREERNFTTGEAPTHIPLHNIKYCYPVVNQKFVYAKEYKKGYIKLKRGQDYLFDSAQWESKVTLTDENDKNTITEMNYNLSDNQVNYAMTNLANKTGYTMTINSYPKNASTHSTTKTKKKETATNLDNDNTFVVTQNQANEVSNTGEIERLTYNFGTSEYATFVSKMRSIKTTNHLFDQRFEAIFLSAKINPNEGYELMELVGDTYSDNKPLVVAEATLKDDYFTKDIDPILYQKHPLTSKYTISRDPKIYGFKPSKALILSTSYLTSLEHDVDINWRKTRFPFRYDLALIYKEDYVSIRDRVLNDFTNGLIPSTQTALDIIDADFLQMRNGKYDVKLNYVLPGNKKNSSFIFNYTNPLRFR
ncbi:hypothetical protein [Aquimarina agarilytica]|uniref:hypothetical protein n=1 Tax=Aquimarina agarilytica TaxID=1087449 RepID=UPI000289CEE3|nr:hypothetical protein [Aquimarina agarilytica]